MRQRLVALVLVVAAMGTACSSSANPAPVDGFLAITDCAELELRISDEVERITATNDRDVIAAATDLYQRIVAHRNAIC